MLVSGSRHAFTNDTEITPAALIGFWHQGALTLVIGLWLILNQLFFFTVEKKKEKSELD